MTMTANGHPVTTPPRQGDTIPADNGTPAAVVFLAPPDRPAWKPPAGRFVAAPVVQPDDALRQEQAPAGDNGAPAARQPASRNRDRPPLRVWRAVALYAIAALIAVASAASFAESFRGLWLWARRHGLSGFWAAAFPLQVDVFIAVGELALFVAMVDRWSWQRRAGAWAVAVLGLAASVAGNVGHVTSPDMASKVTAAVPPLSAFVALWVGLGVLKRVIGAATGGDSPGDSPGDSSADTGVTAASDSLDDSGADTETDTDQDRGEGDNDKDGDNKSPRKPRPGGKADPVTAAIKRHKDWKAAGQLDAEAVAAIAGRCGVSVRTVERRIERLRTGQA